MNTLPQVMETLRPHQQPGDTERTLTLRAAVLMAVAQLSEERRPADAQAVQAETELILAQYPELWPVGDDMKTEDE